MLIKQASKPIELLKTRCREYIQEELDAGESLDDAVFGYIDYVPQHQRQQMIDYGYAHFGRAAPVKTFLSSKAMNEATTLHTTRGTS